jgi:hypothetical protein
MNHASPPRAAAFNTGKNLPDPPHLRPSSKVLRVQSRKSSNHLRWRPHLSGSKQVRALFEQSMVWARSRTGVLASPGARSASLASKTSGSKFEKCTPATTACPQEAGHGSSRAPLSVTSMLSPWCTISRKHVDDIKRGAGGREG